MPAAPSGFLALALAAAFAAPSLSAGSEGTSPLEEIRALIEARRFEEAIAPARAELERREAIHGLDSLEAADAIDVLIRATWESHRAREPWARPLAERAVAIRSRAQGRQPEELAYSVRNLGLLLSYAQQYEESVRHLERAVSLYQEIEGPTGKELAWTLMMAANAMQAMGRYDEARPLHERVLAIREKVHGPDSLEAGAVLHNLGNILFLSGDLPAAKEAYRRALSIRESKLGPDHREVAVTLTSFGYLHWQMGDLDRGRRLLERAIAITEKRLGPDHVNLHGPLNNLGNLLMAAGDLPAARAAHERALAIRERRLGPEHSEVGTSLHNLGVIARKMGDLEGARKHYERSVALIEARLGATHPHVARSLSNLAGLLTEAGRYGEARPLYRRALAISEGRLGADHPATAEVLTAFAGMALAEGSREEARGLVTRARGTVRRHLGEVVAHLPEREALQLLSMQPRPESLIFHALRTAEADGERWLEAAWNWTLDQRGLVLEEMARRRRIALVAETGGVRRAWEDLAAARRDLGELWVGGPGERSPEAYTEALDAARERKEAAEVRLARISARFRENRQAREITFAGVARAIPAKSVLVEILRVRIGLPVQEDQPSHDVALIHTGRGESDWVDLGPAERSDDLVRDWLEALERSAPSRSAEGTPVGSLAAAKEAGRRLRRVLWDPVMERAGSAEILFVVPDGPLHRIDFRTLPLDDGRYLVEEGPVIHLLSTGRDLVRHASLTPGGRGRGLLAMGGPDFDAGAATRIARLKALPTAGATFRGKTSECEAMAARRWAPLPEARREVIRIARILEGEGHPVVLTGADASEERFRREAPGKRILHLATHGFFLPGRCGEEPEPASGLSPRSANPLLLSGLALAGANARSGPPAGISGEAEDGILTAEELAAMDLGGVELAVLSACDTGRGEIAVGEGVFGLRRALEIAGVRSMVMSLWRVPDREARRWMTAFYEAKLSGLPVAEAAHRASLASLRWLKERERPAHPYLWAGFVAAGDWR